MLLNNFYVDNLIKTANTVEELLYLYNESNKIMSEGNFKLRSWSTNCDILKDKMMEDE